jgi:hypothetical protein
MSAFIVDLSVEDIQALRALETNSWQARPIRRRDVGGD